MANLSLNTTTTGVTSSFRDHRVELLAFTIAILIINVLGAVANVLLLLALAIYRPLRNSSSCIFIGHCIVIDLYATVVTVPAVALPLYLGPGYPLPKDFCRLQPLLINSVYVVSLYAASMTALHRLIAAVLPLRFAVIRLRWINLLIILFPWLVTVSLNGLPVFGVIYRMVRSNVTGTCAVVGVPGYYATQLLTTLCTYLPTAVIGACYFVVLLKTAIQLQQRQASRMLHRRMEISRTLFLSFVWHCISTYPSQILVTLPNRESIPYYFSVAMIFRTLLLCFGAVNPIQELYPNTIAGKDIPNNLVIAQPRAIDCGKVIPGFHADVSDPSKCQLSDRKRTIIVDAVGQELLGDCPSANPSSVNNASAAL
ncbi:hypothetical protein BV898_08186 [Hypsibius exemplaris]|uniref:G-protein coupled receptors family 1 profile domain-containing protein n=1 Tax=Hypsibius exemplaris TaxID=2072580 RepID=A0A1W0WRB8_HYPEX|nr:hypothetical protein BV898_08186 [Hypsibius exemplaris]